MPKDICTCGTRLAPLRTKLRCLRQTATPRSSYGVPPKNIGAKALALFKVGEVWFYDSRGLGGGLNYSWSKARRRWVAYATAVSINPRTGEVELRTDNKYWRYGD